MLREYAMLVANESEKKERNSEREIGVRNWESVPHELVLVSLLIH